VVYLTVLLVSVISYSVRWKGVGKWERRKNERQEAPLSLWIVSAHESAALALEAACSVIFIYLSARDNQLSATIENTKIIVLQLFLWIGNLRNYSYGALKVTLISLRGRGIALWLSIVSRYCEVIFLIVYGVKLSPFHDC